MAKGPASGGKAPSGGNAPKYYSSLSCEIRKPWSKKFIFETDEKSRRIGHYCEIELDKSPNETTGTTVTYPVKYGLKGGVWRSFESFNASVAAGLILVKGAWYSFEPSIFEDLKTKGINVPDKFQGEKSGREIFDTNKDLVEYCFQKAAIIYSARKDLGFNAPA